MPAQYAVPRHLSNQQLKNPLIRSAYERLSNIVSYRGQYLRRLDTVHGDRRTRVEKFQVIERVAEQLLVRLDLATGILGFIDPESGRYVLNTQRKIAEDSEGVSSPVLCRLFKTLDEAGYVYRRIERIRLDEKDDCGLNLVRTRVLIRFTKQFWKDLGLAYVFERVQHSAKKKREAQLRELGQRRQVDMERHSKELLRREVSRKRWQAKEARDGDAARMKESRSASPRQDSALTRKGSDDVTSALERLGASFAKKTR
ncbi:hypothetical protein [Pseudomonas syringae]|uniref:hypothetical protein n=1 Tax=Pseudomonas syringae TaxID=317 RepID=UPI000EFAF035|nr:hypothetical protein [Pseudomonas syringae]